MSYRLGPGESLPWTSADRAHTVIVTRTDAGQTWTVTQLRCGRLVKDESGQDARWTHGGDCAYDAEECAMDQARFIAESLRDLGRVATS